MLKRSSVIADTATTSTKSKSTIVRVDGDIAQRYGLADRAEKEAKINKDAAATLLKGVALPKFFEVAVAAAQHGEAPSSIKITDDTGSVVTVAFKSVYRATSPEVANDLFVDLNTRRDEPVDVNDYVHEVPVAKFNMDVFKTPDGGFDENRFLAFQRALNAVSAQVGVPNPLSVENTVVPKDTFHQRRFRDFSSVSDQQRITESLPNTVALTVSEVIQTPVVAPVVDSAPEAAGFAPVAVARRRRKAAVAQ